MKHHWLSRSREKRVNYRDFGFVLEANGLPDTFVPESSFRFGKVRISFRSLANMIRINGMRRSGYLTRYSRYSRMHIRRDKSRREVVKNTMSQDSTRPIQLRHFNCGISVSQSVWKFWHTATTSRRSLIRRSQRWSSFMTRGLPTAYIESFFRCTIAVIYVHFFPVYRWQS